MDQRARILDLRALLLPLSGGGHQHEEAVAGEEPPRRGESSSFIQPRFSTAPGSFRTRTSDLTPLVSPRCAAVAGRQYHPGGEGPDHRRVPGLALPGGEHLLAAVVGAQPPGCLAAPRRPLPDLLRHVRLHGPGLHR